MFCKYCGGRVYEGATYCPHCGRPVEGSEPLPKRQFPWLPVILVILAVAAVGMVIWVVCVAGGEKETSSTAALDTTLSTTRVADLTPARNTEPEESTQPVEGSQPEESTLPETALTDSPEPETTAPRAVQIDDVIGVYARERIQYMDSVGNSYDATFAIPMFILNTPDAKACNEAFLEPCVRELEEARQAQEERYSLVTMGISYEAWLYADTVTLAVTIENSWDCDAYYIYTLDLSSGELLDWEELARRSGFTYDEVKAAAVETLRSYYESLYSGMEQDDFYKAQLERTISQENLEAATLYWNENGELLLLAKVYSLAGANAYERMIPLELP